MFAVIILAATAFKIKVYEGQFCEVYVYQNGHSRSFLIELISNS